MKHLHESLIRLSDHVKKIDHARISRSLGERAKTLEEFGKTYDDLSNTRASVSKMSGKPQLAEQKSALVKVGTALILCPDPFIVPDAVGAALLTAGLLESKFKKKPLTLYDAKKEFATTMKELQKLRSMV